MKIAITGATGFVGDHLMQGLRRYGHTFVPLGRQELSRGTEHLARVIASCGAVINLAGAPIDRRWTEAYKQEIVSSRIETTRLLVETMRQLDAPPQTFISTSAIGAFDSRGEYKESDEANASDFLGQLSKDWETTAQEAEKLEVRTLIFRFGLVLGHDGGMMKKLLTPFRLGLGGPVGSGQQQMSWIHIDDLVEAYQHVLENRRLSGVFHLCAPNPVTNREFSKALGSALGRPALLPVPAFALKLAYGEGADVMTSGQRVISERLPESGFNFRYPDLDSALPEIIKKSGGRCLLTHWFNSRSRSQA
jgi:uncharacterized protein (TIGR01777 family)